MRRIASVFSSKRDKAQQLRSQSHVSLNTSLQNTNSNLTRAQPALTESPTASVLSTPQLSSAASSNCSTSLQTPEVDERPKKSWKSWLPKGISTIKPKRPPDRQLSLPQLIPEPSKNSRPTRHGLDDNEETFSGFALTEITATVPAKARDTLQVLIENSLRHRISAPPFLQLPDVPSYPRSCARLGAGKETLQSSMHKKHLLRRLMDSDTALSRSEVSSLLPFTSKPVPSLVQAQTQTTTDDMAPSKLAQITCFSRGLRSWISRPCFEDRYLVWVPSDDGGIISQQVIGTEFGVAALECSEALEAMVDFSTEVTPRSQHNDESAPPEEPLTPSPSSSSSSLHHPRNTLYTAATPSPLRNEHSPEADTDKITESAPTTKRGVRFAPDDKEDNIPIGYVLRIKKQREQKAKFLREQQERRAFEEERKKVDAERRERDKVRNEWERERRAWEQEKKVMEEEKKQRLFQAEVTAARERREAQRMGGSTRGNMLQSTSSTSLSHVERNNTDSSKYSRPAYDGSRRQASEPAVSTPSSSPHNSSPANSRPSSIAGHGSFQSQRPPSIRSHHSLSSSEDTRPKESSRKRNSMASISSNRFMNDVSSPYGTWSASNSSLNSYSIPPVPAFPFDMPLLPPTAPFMLHQYPRPKPPSNGNPPTSPSRRVPSNHSSEKVNSLNSSSSHQYAAPQRRNTGDDTHRNSRSSHTSSPRTPPSTISRERNSQQTPSSSSLVSNSPWTALPSQTGQYQMTSSYSSPDRRTPPRRQTAMI